MFRRISHQLRGEVARAVMEQLRASLVARPRPAAILYGHPTLQQPLERSLFEDGGVFALGAEGERRTRRFAVGWSVSASARPAGP